MALTAVLAAPIQFMLIWGLTTFVFVLFLKLSQRLPIWNAIQSWTRIDGLSARLICSTTATFVVMYAGLTFAVTLLVSR